MSILWMIVIPVVVVQLSVLFTTIYLHRTVTHRGLEVHPALAALMHLHLALFTGIAPRQWAAVHRKHHQFSDKEGDPHSPRLYGLGKVFWLNAFYYRNAARDRALVAKYTPDYRPSLIDHIPASKGLGIFAGLGLFIWMFGLLWGPALFGIQAVAYILLNSSINSVCHMKGYRNFDNLATNIQWLAFLTAGEALHNNHHEDPTAVRFAMRPGEFDPAWPAVRVMETLGLARIKRAPAKA
jgi:stearoyl-CoA desaturase (Delta-9 desaturase)